VLIFDFFTASRLSNAAFDRNGPSTQLFLTPHIFDDLPRAALTPTTTDPIDAAGWSFLTRASFRVMLGECANERPAGELGNHSYFAYWNVEGVDQLFAEFVAKGAIVSSKPTDKPWGLREFGLSTPDGHRIVCGEVI